MSMPATRVAAAAVFLSVAVRTCGIDFVDIESHAAAPRAA